MTDDAYDDLVRKLDLAQKVRLLTGGTAWRTHAEPDIGLRPIVTSDGPVGVRGQGWDERSTSLTLPSPTALAASWDEDLVGRLGALLAAEARRKGVDVLLAPTINLHRSPLGGRHFECYSEDPLLTARIGAAYIRGVQAHGVAATAKHYVANDSETERLTLDARVDERTLREVYLTPFEAAVEAGVWVVMAAYNGVNGATMTENPLLAEPLKGEWGFDGLVISDWGAVRSTAASARAAQDLVMPGPDGPWGEALVEAVRAGEVPEEAVDDKVRRLLRLASRVGALCPDDPAPGSFLAAAAPAVPVEPAYAERGRVLLREAVAASTVLLRNEGSLLPLDAGRLRRVAVIGPNAATPRVQGGGSAGVYPVSVTTPLEGVTEALAGRAEVAHAAGVHTTGHPTPLGLGNARDPRGGEPGVLVRLLSADGAELHAEHRLTGRILEPATAEAASAVEIRAWLCPPVGGTWRLAVAGWGRVSLAADGRTLLEEEVERDTDDPATVHLHPPYRYADLELTAGRDVELVATRRLDPGTGLASVLAADPPRRGDAEELAAAVELAGGADVAVVVVGSTDESESEGYDRTGLSLPGEQDALVRAVAAANPRTVVVVNAGGPVDLPWREEVPAVLLSWFPGQEYGGGLADVLLGAAEPGGRLPTTWAGRALAGTTPSGGVLEYAEGPLIGYRAWLGEQEPPAYWFGHGLGYTTWAYEGVAAPARVVAGEPFTVRVRLRNTGGRAGREVVQVYLEPAGGPGTARRLAGHARAVAGPGEAVEVAVEVPARALRHWDAERHAWAYEPGPVTVLAGRSAADVPLVTGTTVVTDGPV
ncbi:glycoside hydrolase family 3 C-terminal domain-containing protein [Sphaerisporangium sp. TRM90804]|uniref:glycoside hydrolase family 3 C-terminal domain-containing protein n=1 Tax=Sphaerisporangium sp. TRM90804 TaxID=3031113 RepID=UPI002447E15E|nr:glycoside hydrolase family 3 C-terminal domain-containing protein [Sphaerisporangium sp. TRM90804]MDH2427168.1 glycoside hydrolase family 3 C-terminal domain-containing protein [Sphaerisporangium sp. TRM90804]